MLKAAPHNSARDSRERFCPKIKFGKRRNTLCISSFSNCKIGAKDPLLSADAIVQCCLNPVIVATPSGTNIAVFALSHCGVMGTLNRNGKKNLGLDQQIADWKKISLYL